MKTAVPGASADDAQRKELEEFIQMIGPKLAGEFNDGQLPQLRREIYVLAEILLDFYLEKKRRRATKAAGFDSTAPAA